MLNSFKKTIQGLFKPAEANPAYQLCYDIHSEYFEWKTNGNYMRIPDKEGFLEKEFAFQQETVKVRSFDQDTNVFRLETTEQGELVFTTTILYGRLRNEPEKAAIYIDKFARMTDESRGYGKEVARLIKEFAERRKFDYIMLHPSATVNFVKKTMDQKQLEQFYYKEFSSTLVEYKPVANFDVSGISDVNCEKCPVDSCPVKGIIRGRQ